MPSLVAKVRAVELIAQGNKAVVYTARLVGHPDFSLETSTIRVEPGTTASFAVSFKASTTNLQVSLLRLARHQLCAWAARGLLPVRP